MSRFDQYFCMNEKDAAEYAAQRLDIFAGCGPLECKEIGDGNINYVFRVRDPVTGKSAIIKHSGLKTRSGGSALGFDHSRIEAEILQKEAQYVPTLVPIIYDYDPIMSCMSMEDLSDHAILRYELMKHKCFPRLAEDISDFMAKTLLPTIDAVMDAEEKKEAVKHFTNPPLCKITERLVYTEPYTNMSGKNKVYPANAGFVAQEIYGDKSLHLEAAKLKYEFMNNAQALIHGDLHSGSIFVKTDSTKVFDPEFAFYGPIGYDVGNVIGNMCFAWANAATTMKNRHEMTEYIQWLDATITDIVDLFREKFRSIFHEKATDRMAKIDGYGDWFVGTIMSDSAGVAGLEMIRRTVGVAQVKDITSIENESERKLAERIVLLCAKSFIMKRDSYVNGCDYVAELHSTLKKLAC